MALPSRSVQWSTILMMASVPVTAMLNTATTWPSSATTLSWLNRAKSNTSVTLGSRCSRKNAARRVDRPRKVVGRGYCEVGLQICREAREVALDSRIEILVHHRLVSLVLGLNSHVYLLCVAVTQRSCCRRHAFKKRVACSTKSSGYWCCEP